MQEVTRSDGNFIRTFFEAPDDKALREQMEREYQKAMKKQEGIAEVESIRQSILDPESRCPCGSGKLTKNCCIKRLRRHVANQEHFAAH